MPIGTMNIFILLIIFGTVSESSSTKEGQADGISDFIYKRCRNNVPENTYKHKLNELVRYEDDAFNMFLTLPTGKGEFCSDLIQSSILLSLHNFTQAVMECFPKDEKYIPKFINESYTEYLNFLCASNGKNIDDFYGVEGEVCSQTTKKAKAEICESRLTLPLNGTLTKNQICSDLKKVRICSNDILQQHCSNQTKFISVIGKVYDAVGKPCKTVEDTSQNESE